MTKQEIYKYICDHKRSFNKEGGISWGIVKNIKTHPIFKEINYDFKNAEDLYKYLHDITDSDLKCRLTGCNNHKRFISFVSGYRDFCSDECRNKWLSISRKGLGNPIHRISDENRKKWGEKLSKQKKELIKRGLWTPPITNSWCHSRYNLTFLRNNKLIHQKVRSSWEAFFQLYNPQVEYEKLRIPFNYNDQWHSYIVDFIDTKNKIVFELKPEALATSVINMIKEGAVKKWCSENNYLYVRITEKYFKTLNWNEDLIKSSVAEYDKIKKFKFYFKNEN
jgi:hypothetical protein